MRLRRPSKPGSLIDFCIIGVNLGGWLITEPFIVPALYEKYQNVTPNAAIPGGEAVDEWTLSVAMRNDTGPGGGISQLEDHYKTFIVSTFIIIVGTKFMCGVSMTDGTRFRGDRCCGLELGPSPCSVLGHRGLARRTIPSEYCMDICSKGTQVGSQVRVTDVP